MMRGGAEVAMMSDGGMEDSGIEAGEIRLSHHVSIIYDIS